VIDVEEPRWLNETQNQAWRALLVLVYRGFPEFDRTLKEHGLLVVHYSVLVALSEAPERTLRLSDLADAANVSQSRLTHRLRTLVESGDVDLKASDEDGRGKTATLTKAGLRRLEAVAPTHADDVLRGIFDHLDAAETEALAAALSKVAAHHCGHDLFLA